MSRIDLDIDFSQVVARINLEMKPYKPTEWANMVGVSKNIVTNVHGATQQKPSLEYIVAVSRVTGRSMDYLLWGVKEESKKEIMDSTRSPQKRTERSVPQKDIVPEDIAFDALGMVEGMGLLTKIYASNDNIYIRAINANLMAFSDAVENKAKANDLEGRVREMEADMAEMKRYILEMKRQEEAREKARQEAPSSEQKAA